MFFPVNLINDNETDFGEGDFFCVEGIVARNDDPENRCRVQCLFPQFDENTLYEIWARRFNIYVGLDGFGDYFIPECGTEVLVIGRFGDSNSLFYAPLWNEDIKPSSEFPDKTVAGVRVPQNLKIIAGESAKVQARSIDLIAEQSAELIGQNVNVEAEHAAKILGNQVTINADGSITIKGGGNVKIEGGNVTLSGESVKIHGRLVNKIGGAI